MAASRFCLVVTMLVSGASVVMAQPAEPVLAEYPPDKEVCYGRVYDDAHMARHPRQKVTALYLFRSLTADARDEARPQPRDEIVRSNIDWEKKTRAEGVTLEGTLPGRSSLDVVVAFRGRKTVFKQSVECRTLPSGAFSCGVDCDGGGFEALRAGRSLVIRQAKDSSGLRVQSGCSGGDESAPEVRINPADDALEFRLEPLEMQACHAMRDKSRPSWASASGPTLRERFAAKSSLCFRKTASVGGRRLAIELRTLERLPDQVGEDEPEIRIALVVRDRATEPLERELTCRGEDYSFICGSDVGSVKLTRTAGSGVTLREPYYEGGELGEVLGLSGTGKLAPLELGEVSNESCAAP